MPARHLYFIMTNTWNRLALLIFAVLSLLVAGELQAGVVVGGTRFIFPADRESISILLTNTSQESWLINSKINRPTRWAGGSVDSASTITGRSATYSPEARYDRHVALAENGKRHLAVDRETLFELSIASVPSGKVENQSVKWRCARYLNCSGDPKVCRATRWKLINNYAGHGIRRVYNSLTQRLITLT